MIAIYTEFLTEGIDGGSQNPIASIENTTKNDPERPDRARRVGLAARAVA
jgi:hypothetical protein